MKEIKNILRIIIYSASLYIWYIISICHFLLVWLNVNIGNFSAKDLEYYITYFVLMVIFCFINPFILYSLAKITGVLKLFKKKKYKLIRDIRESNKIQITADVIYLTVLSLLFLASIFLLYFEFEFGIISFFNFIKCPDDCSLKEYLTGLLVYEILILYPRILILISIFFTIKKSGILNKIKILKNFPPINMKNKIIRSKLADIIYIIINVNFIVIFPIILLNTSYTSPKSFTLALLYHLPLLTIINNICLISVFYSIGLIHKFDKNKRKLYIIHQIINLIAQYFILVWLILRDALGEHYQCYSLYIDLLKRNTGEMLSICLAISFITWFLLKKKIDSGKKYRVINYEKI